MQRNGLSEWPFISEKQTEQKIPLENAFGLQLSFLLTKKLPKLE